MRFPRAILAAIAMCPTTAFAQTDAAGNEPETPPVVVDLTLAALSDYRFRGLSLTERKPAAQATITASHRTGLYAFVFGSNVADNGGAGLEVDLGAGFATSLGPVGIDLNAMYYAYPGASSANYAELGSRASIGTGSVELGLSVSYAPPQAALGDESNVYAALDAHSAIPGTPIRLDVSFGIEDGAFGEARRDWAVGLSGTKAGFDIGLTYTDTARAGGDPNAEPSLVLSVARTF